jgi:serine/threonine protein kinase/Flp pilus assembly protein TadD
MATRQVGEMVAAWRRGERPLAEEFIERHPELDADAAIRLIYEEVCLRREAGLAVDHEDILGRFPKWRAELEVLLDCQRQIEATLSPPVLPREGEVLAGFRLVRELGRGAAGTVFLAVQPSLADRPVVLKITPRGRDEHLSLARLQHMNIVPIYSEHVLLARNLQILCMPFLGGATLEQVLDLIKPSAPSDRSGRLLLEALDEIQAQLPITPRTAAPLRQFIARCSYVEAICAIGACLADGLQYAHERGLVHMDIKPSNVLLAGDGQPMLLDFHLARGPIRCGASPPAWAGGTPGYMPPEQWGVVTAVRECSPVPADVDHRADIYSLGALLYEALGGPPSKSPGAPRPPLSQSNSRVSPGLADIVQKCLSLDAADRYRDAAALAGDLRRHLSNLPLQGVRNRSATERWHKWRRRRPVALSRSAILLVAAGSVLLAAGSLGVSYRQRLGDADSALTAGQKSLEEHQFKKAADSFNRGLLLVKHLPGGERRRAALARQLDHAQRGARIDELHELAELIRFRYGLALPPGDEATSLIRRLRAIWEGRANLIQSQAGASGQRFDDRTRDDLRDLVVLWAGLRVCFAASDRAAQANREALRILSEARDVLGSSPSLERGRSSYATMLGFENDFPARSFQARSAWEHLDLGKSYLRSGDAQRAAREFRAGLALRPQDLWLNFYDGLCAYRLNRLDDAVNAFRVAIALAPERPECFFNRGLAYQALGHLDLAAADYDRALKVDAHFTDAALNRGMIHYRLGHNSAARSDLRMALASARDEKRRGTIHYNLALVELAAADRKSFEAELGAALALENPDALELSQRLQR